jgi:uncharacterized RmlC-like cupin family protein
MSQGGTVDRVRIEKVKTSGQTEGSILRLAAIDEPTLWAGISTVPANTSTGWHHHGTNTTVFYMLSGQLTVEHGEDPVESATAVEGDFVVVPAGVIHREVVDPEDDVRAVVLRFGDGTGPLVIEVDR